MPDKEKEPQEFIEASQLRLKPGQWPKTCSLGEIHNAKRTLGELIYVDYQNRYTGVITRVFND